MAKADKSIKTINDLNVSVGRFSNRAQPESKSSGVKPRGTGAATKGTLSRGPMA